MSRALRGLNLGGWLVSERWMTPALYDGVDGDGERAIGAQLGDAEATRRLIDHRDSFITDADFTWIAEHGYDFVRLPVGYWLLEDDHGFVSGAGHLDQAFIWAERHGLRVLLDLHGLQGSQNGRDHSGEVGRIGLHQEDNVAKAVATVTQLARTYGRHDALLGLELINEPWLGFRSARLMRYYEAAVAAVAGHLDGDTKIIVSDAYQARRMAWLLGRRRLGRGPGDQLVLDVHLYRLFTWWHRRAGFAAHQRSVERGWRRLLTRLSRRLPVLVGEWTAELPPAATTVDRDERIRAFYDTQLRVFDELSWAHSYWSYKTSGDNGPWSLRDADLAGRNPAAG